MLIPGKQQRKIGPIWLSIVKNMRYRLRNSMSYLAVLMVLFLSFIAVVLIINHHYENSDKTTNPADRTPIRTPVQITPAQGYVSTTTSPTPSPTSTISPAPELNLSPTPPTPSQTPMETPTPESSVLNPMSPTPSPVLTKISSPISPPSATPVVTVPTPSPMITVLSDPIASSVFYENVLQDQSYEDKVSKDSDESPDNIELIATPFPTAKSTPAPSPIPTAKPASTAAPKPTAIPLAQPSPIFKSLNEQTEETTILIVLDPGHGGIDPGTCSIYKEGLFEKDINLDISLKLKELLSDAGITVLLTRETDTEVYPSPKYNYSENLQERPRIANRNNAALFISIHVNAYDTKLPEGDRFNGTEVYYTNRTYGEFTSLQFAKILGHEIDLKTKTKYNGVREKELTVLKLSNMPAFLIETAYLTNKEDHQRLESNEFRTDMANGIFNGIIEVLKTMGAYKDGNNGT